MAAGLPVSAVVQQIRRGAAMRFELGHRLPDDMTLETKKGSKTKCFQVFQTHLQDGI
jgi:hypothetical protein